MIALPKHAIAPRLTGLAALTFAQYRPKQGRLVAPDVCCDLVWARGHLILTGPMTRAVRSSNVGEDVTLLRLDPLVAHQWLRLPISCLTDRAVELADIDPGFTRELDAMKAYGGLSELVQPATRQRWEDIDARVAAAVGLLSSRTKVANVATMVGLSERQLERLFSDHTGLSPKTFARVLRFRRALKAVKGGASLIAAAAVAGYADQAHFSRDSCALAGASPRAILQDVGNVQDIVAGTI